MLGPEGRRLRKRECPLWVEWLEPYTAVPPHNELNEVAMGDRRRSGEQGILIVVFQCSWEWAEGPKKEGKKEEKGKAGE